MGNVLGRCPVSGIVSEARMGEVDRWYWQASNCPLYIAHNESTVGYFSVYDNFMLLSDLFGLYSD